MTKLASSPERGTFQKDAYLKRRLENNEPIDDTDAAAMLNFYDGIINSKDTKEQDVEWQKDNLEYDLRSTEWIIEKCKDDCYAQNLYAAMCNMQWQKLDVMPILTNQYWHCSWRYAGGIIADIRGQGDYIDWYCSGIQGSMIDDISYEEMTKDQQDLYTKSRSYVSEGTVTPEIKDDLKKLGWQPEEWTD